MSSPGGRIEIRVEPDLRGFSSQLSSGLTSSARTGVAAFASAAKTTLLAAAVGIGAAGIVAAKSTLSIGMAYQDQLNTLQAVSSATEAQMQSVGRTAKQLGSDMSLPATSAADAAAVMTELAKASFSVDEAQQAAKGSLQLAAAAQIDGAQAATIQANAINAFGLAATDATRVADVLANAANASSAEITDVADALAQASAVAASAKIPIEDTAAVIGILANNGIRGSDAGTLLKSALLALQSPSKQAQRAMDDLNLTAYDSQGNFVGLRSIFEQLQVAQGDMTQQQYEMATSTLFGSDAARLAGIAAREGGEGFDVMAAAVARQGSAVELATAKSKGLRGAIEAFKSQVETVQIDVFERAAPSLERLVRAAAERLPAVAASALDTADHVVATFEDMAPRIGRALQARRDAVMAAWNQLGEPLLEGAKDLADKGLDVVVHAAERLSDVAGDAVHTVEPLAKAVGNFATSLTKAGGPLETVDKGLDLLASGAGLALDVLGPFVRLAGNAVDIVSALPGPLESAVVGLAALKVASNIDFFSSRGTAVVSGVGGAVKATAGSVRSLSGEMAVQQALFAAEAREAQLATSALGDLDRALGGTAGSAVAADAGLSRVQQMMRGYDTQLAGTAAAAETASGKLSKLGSAGATLAARGMSAARTAGAGLVSFLGGPLGVALAAGTVAFSAYAAMEQQAAEQAERIANHLRTGGQMADTERAALERATKANDVFKGVAKEVNDVLRQQWQEMSPLQQAQSKVAEWSNTLSYRMQDESASAEDVAIAQQRYAYWSGQVADRQGDLDRATQSATGAMLAQTQAALAASDTNLVLRQQQNQLQQAIQSTQEVLASSTATDLEKSAALLQLESQINTTAEAARQHAVATSTAKDAEDKAMAGDAAYLAQLMATAAQLGSNTPAAIQQTIAALQGTVDKGALATAQFNMLGLQIQAVPDSKTVIVSSTTPEQIALLESMGYKVETLPDGTVKITALTGDAETAIDALTRPRTVRVTVVTETAAGQRVSGGNGPGGTQTKFWSGGYTGDGPRFGRAGEVHFGEFVHDAPTTMRVGRPGMEAIHRGDWATAAARFAELAQTQSRASMAALAGQRAARVAGEYVAGGFVDGRGAMRDVVTVPQRVMNIQNNLTAAPQLPTIDQLQRMLRESEVLAGG